MEKTRTWAVTKQFSEEEQSPFFSYEKQMGTQAVMLDFEFLNGNRVALPYSYLTRIDYDLSKGLTLIWGETRLQVVGRNLETLYKYLVAHRVNHIRESISEEERREVGEYSPYIESLVYEE